MTHTSRGIGDLQTWGSDLEARVGYRLRNDGAAWRAQSLGPRSSHPVCCRPAIDGDTGELIQVNLIPLMTTSGAGWLGPGPVAVTYEAVRLVLLSLAGC